MNTAALRKETVFTVTVSILGGTETHPEAFLSETLAKEKASQFDDPHGQQSGTVTERYGSEILPCGTRCLIEDKGITRVVKLDPTTEEDALIRQGLKKLTIEEAQAMGLMGLGDTVGHVWPEEEIDVDDESDETDPGSINVRV